MLDDLSLAPEVSSAHMNVFAERYNRLLIFARSIVRNDQEHARDLVHDALIEFVRYRPDLHKINNLDGYLNRLMWNLFQSQRRRINRPVCEVSIENLNSGDGRLTEIGDRYGNSQILLQAQDDLRIICEYACLRKERRKLGSVLILRFFHGYYTSEIAQIMGVTASAVSHQLKLAQAEIYLYLNDPQYNGISHEGVGIRRRLRLNYGYLVDNLIDELRCAIFLSSSLCKCTLHNDLRKLYRGHYQEEINCETLAHIVSCPDCLDAVNAILGLELLSMRYPTDTLSRFTQIEAHVSLNCGRSRRTVNEAEFPPAPQLRKHLPKSNRFCMENF